MNDQVSVIVVEDDQMLRESICDYLVLTGFDVEAAGSGLDFYESLKKRDFAVAVIDVGLPDQSGHVLAEYARTNTSMGLVIITANDSIDTRIASYQSGCDLFLAKPVDCRELAAAINSLGSRHRLRLETSSLTEENISSWILERGIRVLVTPHGVRIVMTGKECRLLELLVSVPGETVGREKLLLHLYNDYNESNSRAFDTLLYRLRKKIELHCDSDSPIMTSYSAGYCFSAPIQVC